MPLSSALRDEIARLADTSEWPQHLGDDERFMLAAVVGASALAHADDQFAVEEVEFIERILCPAIAVTSVAGTTFEDLRRLSVQRKADAPGLVAEAAGDLPRPVIAVLLALLAGVVACDGHVDAAELALFGDVAGKLGERDADAFLKRARGASSSDHHLAWPPHVDPAELDSLGVALRASIVRGFPRRERPAPARADAPAIGGWTTTLRQVDSDLSVLRERADAARTGLGPVLPPEILRKLDGLRASLVRPRFQVMVVGEFSHGKSTFLNALVGDEVLPTSALPCSAAPCAVRFGPSRRYLAVVDGVETEIDRDEFLRQATLREDEANDFAEAQPSIARHPLVVEDPSPNLHDGIELLDSPGLHEHQSRTEAVDRELATADAVIMILNASRALAETERRFLDKLLARLSATQRKTDSVFAVLNFADLLRTADEREKVQRRAAQFFGDRIHTQSNMWMISSLHAVEPDPRSKDDWPARFRAMADSLGTFLRRGPGRGRVEAGRTDLLQIFDLAERHFAEQLDVCKSQQARTKADWEAATQAIASATLSKQRMVHRVRKSAGRAATRASDALRIALESAARQLPTASASWKSEHGLFWSKSDLQKDFAAQAVSFVDERLRDFQRDKLPRLMEDELAQLQADLTAEAAEFAKALTSIDAALGLGATTVDESDSTLDRILKHGAGYLAGGPLGALLANGMGWDDVLKVAGLNLAAGLALGALGVGLLPVAAAVAAMTVLYVLVTGDDRRAEFAMKVATEVAEKVRGQSDVIADTLEEAIRPVFTKLADDLEAQLADEIRVKQHDLSLRRELDAGSEQQAAELVRELTASLARVRSEKTALASWIPSTIG